ncbi:MAG: hypothetical protein MJD61_15740 [Proteobacteria bacterium]|nr:hypothetical protein [Pseudomonadota bacterium]
MFSAASFAGVVGKRPAEASRVLGGELPARPTVAFYGFRGGAGRTTALAHVAASLASRQVSVVAVDLDLEAPGLDRVLGCAPPTNGHGVLELLRRAATTDREQLEGALRLAPHLTTSRLEVGAPIRVLPAGALTETYLERLDDLGVPLWHVAEGPSPLEMLVARIKDELNPEVVLVDCRTGLSGLSASALFHVADVVVCMLPVSGQSWDGFRVFLEAVRAAHANREGLPEVLIVPSMVPEGPEGRYRLAEFVSRIEAMYAELVLGQDAASLDDADVAERVPVAREGIEYRRGIALADALSTDFVQRSAGTYRALLDELDALLLQPADATVAGLPAFEPQQVLDELSKRAGLSNLAFAESTDPATIVQNFVDPGDFKAILDRATWYVVGSKGSGKTWLYAYLSSKVGQARVTNMTFLPAHASKDSVLTASAFRELEQHTRLKLKQRQLHGAFWLLYAANRLFRYRPDSWTRIAHDFPAQQRRLVGGVATASTPRALQTALERALAYPRAGTLAEELVRSIDGELLSSGDSSVVLLYDGLDIGFGSDARSLERRQRFVNGLVEALENLRGVSRKLSFKVFLREDIYSDIDIQNQSHLAAATVQLRWDPSDLWRLGLNIAATSETYMKAVVHGLDPSAAPGRWPQDEGRLRRLLIPLWGDSMEKGKKVSTARFIQRRTSDGLDRMFPRTFVQLLAKAIEHQRSLEPLADRVLRSAAIQHGYTEASAARVDDLQKEYVTLSPYLSAIQGMKPTGTLSEVTAFMKKELRKAASRKKSPKGAPAGALHAGPGGWNKVIKKLLEVGVLREYRRARGDAGETKYEISLLYRPGLGIKAYGI